MKELEIFGKVCKDFLNILCCQEKTFLKQILSWISFIENFPSKHSVRTVYWVKFITAFYSMSARLTT